MNNLEVRREAKRARKREAEEARCHNKRARQSALENAKRAWTTFIDGGSHPQVPASAAPGDLVRRTHPSHELFLYGGFLLCRACGAVASDRLHLLARVCRSHLVNTAALSRLGRGELCAGYESWPDDRADSTSRRFLRIWT